MTYDLVIKNGTVVDGSGGASYQADVAISGDRIAEIGKITEKADAEIDAEGHVVTPGFIDGHAHMDAQVFWDELGSCSCWHGVTSVVMGNCGFTLAPSRPDAHNLVVTNLERAEDISGPVMAAGIDWTWESFPEYLDAVEARPKAINYASQIGHSALRTFAMGARAFSEQASPDDLALMIRTLREALHAGAFGFSTSRSNSHATADGRPVASCIATWEELHELVGVLGKEGAGVFEIDPGNPERSTDPKLSEGFEVMRPRYDELKDLAISSGVPVIYGIARDDIQYQFDVMDATAAAGGKLFGQSLSIATLMFSFKSQMPYDRLPEWSAFRARPLADQKHALRDPLVRKRLIEAVEDAYAAHAMVKLTSSRTMPNELPPYEVLKVLRDGKPNQSVASLAAERGVHPMDLMIDLALETNFEQVFGRFAPWSEEALLHSMQHPRSIMTFSDSGAHVSCHSGAEIQTHLLAYWVREREEFTLEEAIRMMTLLPATFWQMPDRGLLRGGMIADINVIDPKTVANRAPTIETDLPAGGIRVNQKATGYLATLVGGKQTFQSGEHTGELPGRLIRGPLAGASSRR